MALFWTILGGVWKVLTIGIIIPIWLILLVLGWSYIDKNWSVKRAVNKAVTELVAGAELKAAAATIENEKRLRTFAEGSLLEAKLRAEAAERANTKFQVELEEKEKENEELEKELQTVADLPLSGECKPTPELLNSLRNK